MPRAPRIHSFWIRADGREGASSGPSLLFPYWSFTKTALAICALKLAENGKIDLDASLQGEPYSLRQLLGHTAGLPDYGSLDAYHLAVQADEAPWPRDELLEKTMAQGFLFQPGCGWSYSNLGYMLAREHIEAMAGEGFESLFKKMIRDPLGLESVTLATTREQFAGIHWAGAARYHPGWVYHGCLAGSAGDAARLLHALFSGEILGTASLRSMLAARHLGGAIAGRPWTACGYGLGLMSGMMTGAGRAIGHSGGGPFCVNAVYHFPDLGSPITVASFADENDEGAAEFEAVEVALAACPA